MKGAIGHTYTSCRDLEYDQIYSSLHDFITIMRQLQSLIVILLLPTPSQYRANNVLRSEHAFITSCPEFLYLEMLAGSFLGSSNLYQY